MEYPLYFIPNLMDEDLSALKRTPVADILSDLHQQDQVTSQVVTAGPGGQPGVMFCVPVPGAAVDGFGFFPEQQTWSKTPDDVWVGRRDGLVVTAEMLDRVRCPVSDFALIEMADFSQWEVPVLRDPMIQFRGSDVPAVDPDQHTTTLAGSMAPDWNNAWRFEVTPAYAGIFAESRSWFNWLMEAGSSGAKSFGFAEVFEYAIRVLSLRYRYGIHLHSALKSQLLQTDQVSEILSVSCGWHLVNQWLQKKSPELSRLSRL